MPAVVATSGAGNFAIANANVRSGNSTMPVPSAMTANPNQIQFTSGLMTISRFAVWSAHLDTSAC